MGADILETTGEMAGGPSPCSVKLFTPPFSALLIILAPYHTWGFLVRNYFLSIFPETDFCLCVVWSRVIVWIHGEGDGTWECSTSSMYSWSTNSANFSHTSHSCLKHSLEVPCSEPLGSCVRTLGSSCWHPYPQVLGGQLSQVYYSSSISFLTSKGHWYCSLAIAFSHILFVLVNWWLSSFICCS